MGFLRHRNAKFTSETLILLSATLALIVFAVGCAGGTTSSAEPGNEAADRTERQAGETDNEADQAEPGDSETSGEATIREDGQIVAGDVTVGSDGQVIAGDVTVGPDGQVSGEGVESSGGEEPSGGAVSEATLEMAGDPGTAFSGTCVLGEEEMDVSGEVPASFTLPLDGQKLDCEIRKEGEGKLRMVLEAGNSRNVYQTTSSDATVKLTYSGNGVASFSSSSSSGSSSSVVQQSSSSSVVQQQSSR